MGTCADCGAPCQGARCRQCEVENAHAHLADELARDDETEGDDD